MKKTYFLVLIFFIYAGLVSALPDGNKEPPTDPFKKYNQPSVSMTCSHMSFQPGRWNFQFKGNVLYVNSVPFKMDDKKIIRNKETNQFLLVEFSGGPLFFFDYFVDFDNKKLVISEGDDEELIRCY